MKKRSTSRDIWENKPARLPSIVMTLFFLRLIARFVPELKLVWIALVVILGLIAFVWTVVLGRRLKDHLE